MSKARLLGDVPGESLTWVVRYTHLFLTPKCDSVASFPLSTGSKWTRIKREIWLGLHAYETEAKETVRRPRLHLWYGCSLHMTSAAEDFAGIFNCLLWHLDVTRNLDVFIGNESSTTKSQFSWSFNKPAPKGQHASQQCHLCVWPTSFWIIYINSILR